MDLDSRVTENAGLWDDMLPKAIEHFIQGPCYQWGGSQKDPSSHCRIWWTPGPGQEIENKMVWPHLKVVWFSKDVQGKVKRKKRDRQKKSWEDNIKQCYENVKRQQNVSIYYYIFKLNCSNCFVSTYLDTESRCFLIVLCKSSVKLSSRLKTYPRKRRPCGRKDINPFLLGNP